MQFRSDAEMQAMGSEGDTWGRDSGLTDDPFGAAGERHARELDAVPDPAARRTQFAIPLWRGGAPTAYFAGNSLGLQPRTVVEAVGEVLDAWATHGVAGHALGEHPWMPYHTEMRETVARLVGGLPGEAVVMNSLTVNLHLLLTTFYRPDAARFRIAIERDAFPSDQYAVDSQVILHGHAAGDAVIRLAPSDVDVGVTVDDVRACLTELGDSVAIVLLGGVNFRTGALLDIPSITAEVHRHGGLAAWDLAHAVGNVPLELHAWEVDFAVWCSYKYLNAGPGSIGGCFVHERWGKDASLPRPSGWWGHDPSSRFAMPDHFVAQPGAEGWQVSNPPILSMAAVRASLAMFDEIGMTALRRRSLRLTGYLESLLDLVAEDAPCRIVTPRDPLRRGAQLSIEVPNATVTSRLLDEQHGVVADERPPNIVRFAPAPLYTSFHDCWRAAAALREVLS